MQFDNEFTGAKLHQLVLDIEMAVGKNAAGLTPLGMAVTDLAERAIKLDRAAAQTKPTGK